MADRYTGIIEILKRDIERFPEIKDEVYSLFYDLNGKLYDNDMWDEDSPVATFKDIEARYGCFEDLEELLVELEVPFDRWSDAYCEWDSETVFYRPAINKKEVFCANGDGNFIFLAEDIRALEDGLDLTTTKGLAELGKRLKEKLAKIPDIPALKDCE